MENKNQPAFPVLVPDGDQKKDGLTKREYFAAMAMQGIMASWNRDSMPEAKGIEQAVIVSVEIADTLLKELEKQ